MTMEVFDFGRRCVWEEWNEGSGDCIVKEL
jgi:hypothetical protein